MALLTHTLSTELLETLIDRGHSLEKIRHMTAAEAFDEACDYQGLIGWGPTLRSWMDQLHKAQPHVYGGKS